MLRAWQPIIAGWRLKAQLALRLSRHGLICDKHYKRTAAVVTRRLIFFWCSMRIKEVNKGRFKRFNDFVVRRFAEPVGVVCLRMC